MVILASANITFFDSIIKQISEKIYDFTQNITFYSNFALTILAHNGKLFELFVFFTLLSLR